MKRLLLSLLLTLLVSGPASASWIPAFNQDFILKNVLPSTRGGIYPTDIVELQQIMKKHDIIRLARRYNVNLQLGRKSVAYRTYRLVAFNASHTKSFEQYIVSVKNSLLRYPASFFRQLRLTLYLVYDISGNIAGLACGREIILGSSSEQTLHHEIGHVVNNVFPELNSIWKNNFWPNGKDPDRSKYVSSYAMTNYREDFAETFGSLLAYTVGKRWQYIKGYPNLNSTVMRKIRLIQSFLSRKEPVYTANYWHLIMYKGLAQALNYRNRLVAAKGGGKPLSSKELKDYYNNILKTGLYAKDLVQVKQALDNGADPNIFIYASYKWSALHFAAQRGNYQIVQLLLKRGADKNLKDRYGKTPGVLANDKGYSRVVALLDNWTKGGGGNASSDSSSSTAVITVNYNKALLAAARNGDLSALRRALSNGASVDYRGGSSWTPLLYMANKRNLDGVKLLVEKGANIDHQGSRGWTPLLIAAYWGEREIAAFLLGKGARKDLTSGRGETALQLARRRGHTALVKLFSGGNSGNRTKLFWNKKLLSGALKNSLAAVKQALSGGADINSVNSSGWTALMIAVYKNNSQMVRFLLAKGADKSLNNKGGYSALKLAGYYRYSNLVRLLDSGTTVKKNWDMELLKAAYKNSYSGVVNAVQQGADVNTAVKSSEWRAVHYVAYHGNLRLLRYLVSKGANLEAATVNQQTALSIARRYNRNSIVNWISNRISGDGNGDGSNNGNNNGNNIGSDDDTDDGGDNSSGRNNSGSVDLKLLQAAYKNSYSGVKQALGNGANVDAPAGRSLWRAVHYAASHGNVKILQLLLNNGADFSVRTAQGYTPDQIARRYRKYYASSWIRSRQ